MGRYDKKIKKTTVSTEQVTSWCPACIIICSGSCTTTCSGTANLKAVADETTTYK